MPVARAQPSGNRPGAGGPPTEITVKTYIVDIDDIDNVEEVFTIDIFVYFSWNDPRLALPADTATGDTRVYPMDEIWTPRLVAANSRGLEARLPQRAEVDDAGNVLVTQRYFGDLAVDMDLHAFPFDTQVLPIELLSYGHDGTDLTFNYDVAKSGRRSDLSAEGWTFSDLPVDTTPFVVEGTGVTFPQLGVRIQAERQAEYYLLTMMFPMSLIIFMAWSVFWLPPSVIPPRVAVSSAAIFSLMALGFTIRTSLPQVAYVTRADVFVLGATLLVFLALGVAVASSRMALNGNDSAGDRLNIIMRWSYPALFCLIVVGARIA